MHDQDRFCDLLDKDLEKFSPQFIRMNVRWTSIIDYATQTLVGGKRLPGAVLKTKELHPTAGPYKKVNFCVCCMLDGSPMTRVKCRIYARRPAVCKTAVRPGDKNCVSIRRILLSALSALEKE
jgi:Fe-S-cluster containining protein